MILHRRVCIWLVLFFIFRPSLLVISAESPSEYEYEVVTLSNRSLSKSIFLLACYSIQASTLAKLVSQGLVET